LIAVCSCSCSDWTPAIRRACKAGMRESRAVGVGGVWGKGVGGVWGKRGRV
jgi:hypothetical protein